MLVQNRYKWYRAFQNRGIEVALWWEGYHRGVNWDEFDEARHLKDHLLVLPIHQQLSATDMECIVAAAKSFCDTEPAHVSTSSNAALAVSFT